jgi:hypothetical protein
MIRRGFFKSLAAATTAMYAARSPTTAIAAVPTRALSPSPRPIAPKENPDKWVRDLLEQCVVVGYQSRMAAGELRTMDVEYVYDPDNKWTGPRLNDELRSWLPAKSGIRSVNVVVESPAMGMHLGALTPGMAGDLERRIEVEWICCA